MITFNGTTKKYLRVSALGLGFVSLLFLVGCPEVQNSRREWPISDEVFTTAEEQILPIGLSIIYAED